MKTNQKIVFLIYSLFLLITGFEGVCRESFHVRKTEALTLFRLQLHGLPNYLDECVFYYQDGATNGFDSEYDAYKLSGPNTVPQISIDNDSLFMSINGIPPVTQTYSTNILVTTNTSGNYTITASDVQGLPPGTCVFLKDLETGSVTDLLLSPYVFNLLRTTTTSRFVILITYNTLPLSSVLIQPTCQHVNGGTFSVSGNDYAPWNYIWKDTSGVVLKTSMGINTKDSLSALRSGSYMVEVSSANNACLRNEVRFTIDSIILPVTGFIAPDTIAVGMPENFSAINSSSNCVEYFWNFGDGIGSSNRIEETYSFSSMGGYQVKLTGTSISGCKDSTVRLVNVVDLTTPVHTSLKDHIKILSLGSNVFGIKTDVNSGNELEVMLIHIQGEKLFDEHYKTGEEIILQLQHLPSGVYLLYISVDEAKSYSTRLVIQ